MIQILNYIILMCELIIRIEEIIDKLKRNNIFILFNT